MIFHVLIPNYLLFSSPLSLPSFLFFSLLLSPSSIYALFLPPLSFYLLLFSLFFSLLLPLFSYSPFFAILLPSSTFFSLLLPSSPFFSLFKINILSILCVGSGGRGILLGLHPYLLIICYCVFLCI